jgi:hypothetical protein
MRILLVFIVILFSSGQANNAQNNNPFDFQLLVSTDNDAYVFWENFDRYYTYGINIELNYRSNRLLGLEKLFKKKNAFFFSTGIRSEAYTPTRQKVSDEDFDQNEFDFERPFAGLLFGVFSANYTFEKYFIKTELFAGIMGPSAYTKEIQDWIHENITDDDLVYGWDFQIPDQAILNINFSAAHQLYSYKNWLDIYARGELRFGNLYIDATPLLGFRFGKFASLTRSNALGNGLLAPLKIKELFIRSTFSATAVAFDGTAQGNIFKDES